MSFLEQYAADNSCSLYKALNDNLDHFTLEAIEFMEEEGLEAESTDFSVNFCAKYKGFL